VRKLHEVSVPPAVFALYFFNEAYFAETAPDCTFTIALRTINNTNDTKKVQSSDTEAPKARGWTDAVAWDR
jgi:hypothetical protein